MIKKDCVSFIDLKIGIAHLTIYALNEYVIYGIHTIRDKTITLLVIITISPFFARKYILVKSASLMSKIVFIIG